MELNFFKKKRDSFLVLDIGTEAVKALIFKKNNEKIFILGSAVRYFEDEGIFNKAMSLEEFEIEKTKRAMLECVEDC